MADSRHARYVSDPADPIRAILLSYADNNIGVCGADFQIINILFKKGQCSRKKLHALKVGIHRRNRGSVIGHSMEVPLLMGEISDHFWNPEQCAHALCVEIEAGDYEDENAFRDWCESATVDFPIVVRGSLEAVALACSHTNCGLRAIAAGCLSTDTRLGDGVHYDVEVIRKKDKVFAEAVDEGMTWVVVLAVVLQMYPELVELWTVSRNTQGHIQRPENEITGLSKLLDLWTKEKEKGNQPDYFKIVKCVTRGKPWWAALVPHFVAFLFRHSGGLQGRNWNDFKHFHAHCIQSNERQMPGYVWENLAKLSETFCVYAILHAAYTCPEGDVEEKKCISFRISDLRSLQQKTSEKRRTEAELFLKSVFKLFGADGDFTAGAKAAVIVRPGVKGYDSQAKAERTETDRCRSFYIKVSVMVGRYLCRKLQDEDFGKDLAENLGDVLTRLLLVRQEWFPDVGTLECLETIVVPVGPSETVVRCVPAAFSTHQSKAKQLATDLGKPQEPPAAGRQAGTNTWTGAGQRQCQTTSIPRPGATAAAGLILPDLSELDAAGNRTGCMDRLHANSMRIGSKVASEDAKGTYEIAGFRQLRRGGVNVSLSLAQKHISMDQLWMSLLDAKGASGSSPDTAALGSLSKAGPKPKAKASAAPSAADASGADSRATAAGETTELGATAAAEPENFPRERAVDLDIFLEKWRLELATPIVEHAFNPNWPENRLATQKNTRSVSSSAWFSTPCIQWVGRSTGPSSRTIASRQS